jgi:hypothetical protein
MDSYFIDEAKGIRQIPQVASKYGQNPILSADHPWETSVVINSGGPAVIFDSEAQIFRMLYFTYGSIFQKTKGLNESFIPSYATSKDGIHWEKPDLGLVEFGGTTQNSILPWLSQVQNGSTNVICDPIDPDPARRYKSAYYSSRPSIRFDVGPEAIMTWDPHRDAHGVVMADQDSAAGLFVSFSPDEIHWEDFPGNPVLDSQKVHDTHSLLGWDERIQKYVGYFRPAFGAVGQPKVRVIGRSESSDFLNWTEPSQQIVLQPDIHDDKGTEFYCMAAMEYEGCYLGLLWIYHNDPHWPWPKGTTVVDDQLGPQRQTMDAQMVTSRDGIHWERTQKREPVIPLGPPGSWDDGMVFASTPVVVGDEVWAYYGGTNMKHTGESLGNAGRVIDGARKTMGVGLAKWRLDGFVSTEPVNVDGTLLTKPMTFSGDQLWLNADASKGSISVEVLDENGRAIPRFSKSNSVPLRIDAVRQQVTWGDRLPSLGSIAGKPVRFKFYLHNAKLFSFCMS